jgi:hypothetical protein
MLGWDYAQLLMADESHRDGSPMLIVAHRGNMEAFPENTAEAIWDAARMGADGIEFDVHQSRDGTWWVIHDETVDRTTDGAGAVRDLSDAALGALRVNAGPGFDPDSGETFRLARLSTVLSGLSAYDGRLYVDLQHAVAADAADLADRLRGYTATIICRTLDDARLAKATNPAVGTLIRIDRIPDASQVDAVFFEAFREVTHVRVASAGAPVVTFLHEAYDHLGEERVLLGAVSVATALPQPVHRDTRVIRVRSYDAISLELTGNRTVVWGSPEYPEAKAAALTAAMKAAPEARHFDVSVPSAPAVSAG